MGGDTVSELTTIDAPQSGMNTIDMAAINAEVEAGFVYRTKHPDADLFIYNYSPRAQYDWHWTPATRVCRGLIMDADDNIVARPFEKFFTLDQLARGGETVPAEPFQAFEKYDGSLGILYWLNGQPKIATRGSFTSEQAVKASAMLDRYPHALNPDVTLLFEIIYPANRIVVNYGDDEQLILLAAIETVTGRELDYSELSQFGFPVAKRHDGLTDFNAIRELQQSNAEGFVVRFESGMRVKIKFDEYKRLHKLLTGITPRHIWEMLRDGKSMDPMYEQTPDEFHGWLRTVLNRLHGDFAAIENRCREQLRSDFPTRKDAAAYFTTCEYPPVMFAMFDKKNHASVIWKLVRPEAARAFRCDDEAT